MQGSISNKTDWDQFNKSVNTINLLGLMSLFVGNMAKCLSVFCLNDFERH